MDFDQQKFGTLDDGREVSLISLKNDNGISIKITNWGGIVTSVRMPDRYGYADEITLGFETLGEYLSGHPFFGALIGRYANRISRGVFEIEGKCYHLACNDGPNHLHGGDSGFDKVLWKAGPIHTPQHAGVELSYSSANLEEGYPGNLEVIARYVLNEKNEFSVEFEARTDRTTIVNLTNHCYWNLSGAGNGPVTGHRLRLNCSQYLPVDATQIPTGEIASVTGGAFDFRMGKNIGDDLKSTDGGYDHCMIIDDPSSACLKPAAEVLEPISGRGMRIFTTKPALQFYSGVYLDGIEGSGGKVFDKLGGFCLETQYYPDAVNQNHFSNCILKPNQVYRHRTIHQFFGVGSEF